MNHNTLPEPYKTILTEPMKSYSGIKFMFESTYNLYADDITDKYDFGNMLCFSGKTSITIAKYEVIKNQDEEPHLKISFIHSIENYYGNISWRHILATFKAAIEEIRLIKVIPRS